MRFFCVVMVLLFISPWLVGCDEGNHHIESDGDVELDADTEADPDADFDEIPDADETIRDADDEQSFDADLTDSDSASDADPDEDAERMHQDIEHLNDDELIDALNERVRGHTSLGYDDGRDAMFTDIDVHGGLIECVYTGFTTEEDGTRTPGPFDTEHSWTRARGAGSEPALSDIHHLFPTHSDANSRRGGYRFGNTSCSKYDCDWFSGGSELGDVEGGTDTVFEVRTETRGDIARAQFYFSVRYQLDIEDSEEVFLRQWHEEDPVSDRERDRNEAIESYQHNRNPFIDRPGFVGQIADF